MTDVLHDVVWVGTLITGLALSVLWRGRLGRGAVPAFAGFAVLLLVWAGHLLWTPTPVAPASGGLLDVLAAVEPADLTVMAILYAAYPLGLALLLLAVLRARTPSGV